MTRGEILAKRIELRTAELDQLEREAILGIEGDFAVRNMASSSMHVLRRTARRIETLKTLLAERLRLEEQTGVALEDEGQWHADLVANINGIADRRAGRIYEALEQESRQLLGGDSGTFREGIRSEIESLRGQRLLEADIIKAEREHKKRVLPAGGAPSPHITLNISQSQIAGLNVAGTVGSIQATVNSLGTSGEKKVAEALKALTEAIAADSALPADAKSDSLAHVSAVGEELARPHDQQRPAVFRAIAGGLVGTIRHANKVYAAYEVLKKAVSASGIELP